MLFICEGTLPACYAVSPTYLVLTPKNSIQIFNPSKEMQPVLFLVTDVYGYLTFLLSLIVYFGNLSAIYLMPPNKQGRLFLQYWYHIICYCLVSCWHVHKPGTALVVSYSSPQLAFVCACATSIPALHLIVCGR